MSAAAVAESALLALGIAAVWLAALGLLRLRDAYARLHCAGFAIAAGGFGFAAAVLTDRGGSALGLKSLAAVLLLLLSGAVATHATGRALRRRGQGAARER